MVKIVETPLRIPGGIKLEPNKQQSLRFPITKAALPEILTVPLDQHIGNASTPIVNVGQQVLKGQMIAKCDGFISAPVHAPSSGTVIDIADYYVPHPSGQKARCIRIETDGKDTWCERNIIEDPLSLDPVDIRMRVMKAGIVGLGGAGFPAAAKCAAGLSSTVELIILNAVECEPYISCDEALMKCRADEVIEGLRIMRHALQAKQCVIGIEDNMPDAAKAMQAYLDDIGETDIRLIIVPAIYPEGGEKQLIYSLTGEEIPNTELPIERGIICHNVGTSAAVFRAAKYTEPLISRIITITGSGVKEPQNFDALIGTSVSNLIEQAGGYSSEVDRLLMGGPMMGFSLQTDTLPVIKTTNCLLATSQRETPPPAPAKPCIRCSKCAEVCPAGLLPQQLFWYAQARDFEKTESYNLFDCIECGCCAYVCPSSIPLVQYYRFAKSEIRDTREMKRRSDIARERHEARDERLLREKRELAERRAKHKKAAAKPGNTGEDSKQAAIKAAVERVKAKKQALQSSDKTDKQV
ncbi:MAG: electron transport complex subunit RsxC [Gammaproteobacteria bacterium]